METTWKRCLKCGKTTLQTIKKKLTSKGKIVDIVECPCGKWHYVAW